MEEGQSSYPVRQRAKKRDAIRLVVAYPQVYIPTKFLFQTVLHGSHPQHYDTTIANICQKRLLPLLCSQMFSAGRRPFRPESTPRAV